jgi:plasmid stabilization system protein ParE
MGKVIWTNPANKDFEKAIKFIAKRNPLNAITVKDNILFEIFLLLKNPDKNIPDNLKKDNDGSFRFFIIYEFKISYKIIDEGVLIVRFRHMKQKQKIF